MALTLKNFYIKTSSGQRLTELEETQIQVLNFPLFEDNTIISTIAEHGGAINRFQTEIWFFSQDDENRWKWRRKSENQISSNVHCALLGYSSSRPTLWNCILFAGLFFVFIWSPVAHQTKLLCDVEDFSAALSHRSSTRPAPVTQTLGRPRGAWRPSTRWRNWAWASARSGTRTTRWALKSPWKTRCVFVRVPVRSCAFLCVHVTMCGHCWHKHNTVLVFQLAQGLKVALDTSFVPNTGWDHMSSSLLFQLEPVETLYTEKIWLCSKIQNTVDIYTYKTNANKVEVNKQFDY